MISNIPSSSKGDTGKKSVTEYVEDDVDELTYSDFPDLSREYLMK